MGQVGSTYVYDPNKTRAENDNAMKLQGLADHPTAKIVNQAGQYTANTGSEPWNASRFDHFTNVYGLTTNELNNAQGQDYYRMYANGQNASQGGFAPPTGMSATQLAGYSGVTRDAVSGIPTTLLKPPTEIAGQSLTTAMETAEQRYLSQILGDIDTRRTSTNMGYADLYNQMQNQKTRRGGLSDATGFTGGMQQQFQDKVSAAEMAQMMQAGTQRTAALGELEAEGMAAESNAKIMAQQEFEMMATQQNQYIGTANNYYALAQEATAAGDTARANTLKASADQAMEMANKIGSQMGASAGTVPPGGTVPTQNLITVPTIDVKKEMTGNLGVTQVGSQSAQELAATLSVTANAGVSNYGGISAEEMRTDSVLLDKLSSKLLVDKTGDTITLNMALDQATIAAIQDYEKRTGKTVLKWAGGEALAYGAAGAAGGALIGTGVGSVLPVAGNIAGGVIGGVSGGITGTTIGLMTFNVSKTDVAKIIGETTIKYQQTNALLGG